MRYALMRENMVLFWKKLNYFYLIFVLFCFVLLLWTDGPRTRTQGPCNASENE